MNMLRSANTRICERCQRRGPTRVTSTIDLVNRVRRQGAFNSATVFLHEEEECFWSECPKPGTSMLCFSRDELK